MDNEELKPEVETEDQNPELDNFDALWNDDDEFVPSNEPDAQPEAKEDEAEEKTEEEPANTDDAQPKQKPEAENQRFKLKVNGEEIEVGLDEVITLAQKGKDYDRVKTERDNLKTDSATMNKLKAQGDFLEELAKSSDMTVDQLMENVRVQMAMDQDKNLSEAEARAKVKAEAAARQQPAEAKVEEKAKEPSPEERRQAMFANFLQAYPDVKAEDIPQEVWNDAGRTFDLVGAYQRHENRELRKEIETLRQNNKNKERSTGSTKSAGTRNANQAFDALWYDDDD